MMMIIMCCTACCQVKLMDTSREVIVETGRTVTPGVYRAASLRVCTADELFVQAWTPVNRQTYQLKWQKSFRPTTADTAQNWATVITVYRYYCFRCFVYWIYFFRSDLTPAQAGSLRANLRI